ncbi:MAG: hypothetical protein ACK5V5_06180 [Cyclobacteriaceae bacterium]
MKKSEKLRNRPYSCSFYVLPTEAVKRRWASPPTCPPKLLSEGGSLAKVEALANPDSYREGGLRAVAARQPSSTRQPPLQKAGLKQRLSGSLSPIFVMPG